MIESALSVVWTATARVKTWKDADTRVRWYPAGLLKAEEKGYKQMPTTGS